MKNNIINKKAVIIFVIILLVVGVAYAAGILIGGNSHEDINDGLVLSVDLTQDNYISGTKTFTDDSGEGNNCVSANAATFKIDKYGKSTGATNFNGAGDYLDCGTDGSLNFDTNNFTVSVWAKANGGVTGRGILNKGGWGSVGYAISEAYSPSNRYYFVINDGSYKETIFPLYETWDWTHIVGIKTENHFEVWVDGAYAGAWDGALGSLSNPSKAFEIGRSFDSSYFNGSISEVKIWNRELSAVEVRALYNSSKPKMSTGSISSGLVGHWALNGEGYNSATGRVTDKSAYENHGTNSGANLTTDRMGQSNGAMYFDGENDYIDAGTNSIFSFSDNFTLNAWIKPSSISPANWGGVITKDDESGSTTHRNYWFGQQAGSDELCFFWHTSGGTNNYGICTTNTNLIANNWFNIVAVVNDLNLNIYVNGINKTLNTVEYGPGNTNVISFQIDNSVPVKIGRSNPAIHPFNGSMADVRIYNRVLSYEEILALNNSYNAKLSSGSLYKGLVLDMPLTSDWTKTEVAGSEIMTDKTPYTNDGQNYGATVGNSYTTFGYLDNDSIIIPAKDSLSNIDTITVSAWIKTNTIFASVVSNRYNVDGYGTWYTFYAGEIEIGDNAGGYAFEVFVANTTDNNWHNIAYRKTGTNHSIYIDGNFDKSFTASSDISQSVPLFVGKRWTNMENGYYDGLMSNVRVYNRALSDEEIKLLYDKGR